MIKVKKKKLKSEKQLHFETPVDWTARMPVITATFVSNREKKNPSTNVFLNATQIFYFKLKQSENETK